MPELLATDEQLKIAEEEVPHDDKEYLKAKYRYWGHVRCSVKGDLLKVAFYYTENLRAGGSKPHYAVYFNKKTKEYLTYDYENKKWLTATFYNLVLPEYSHGKYEEGIYTSLRYSDDDEKTICDYFGGAGEPFQAMIKFQRNILSERLEAKHKRETDPWDEDLKRTPKIPKAFEHWVEKDGIPEHFIFYDYLRKRVMPGWCSYCEKDVLVEHPTYNAKGICPYCRHEVTFKSIGRVGFLSTENHIVYLLQKCEGGMIIREFTANRFTRRFQSKSPEIKIHENRRIFCDEQGNPISAYFYGWYKYIERRWIKCDVYNAYPSIYYSYCGKVYPYTLSTLNKTVLKKTGLLEYYAARGVIDPESYLCTVRSRPYIEKIVKAGLSRLAIEEVEDRRFSDEGILFDLEKSTLKGILRINDQELKRMRVCNGGRDFLRWLQYEKAVGAMIADTNIKWLCNEKVKPGELKFIRSKMSIPQIVHYVTRQMRENQMDCKTVLQTWEDYLSMATRLGMDTNDEIVFRTSKLRKRHDELVERMNKHNLSEKAGKILMDYPNVEKIFSSIKEMYEYADERYTVIVPERIEDVLNEGNALNHCVANSERYWDRIERQESYIMFLRKTSAPDKPYYTLEVEPGGTIRQKRTNYDRQEADIEKATDFLRTWQRVISKRITEKERKLAETSRVLRLAEFKQLKKDQTIIHVGNLAGQKLVDVLMKDLMEAA